MNVLPTRVKCLSAVEIFCDLTPEEIGAFIQRAPIKHVEAKTILYSPENPTEVLYMVNEGRVQTYHLAPDGGMLTSAILETGTLFGEMTLLGQTLQGHYAQTLTACTLCVMNAEDVHRLLLADARIAYRIIETLGKRLIEMQHHLSVLTYKHMPERVAALLVQIAKRSQDREAQHYEARCTHETLASMVGANRETVTKILSDLRAQQIIELHRGRIVVLNMQKLVAIGAEIG
jgi:CRP/FNR family transcriptional regulator, cyclic AMP receptor protein